MKKKNKDYLVEFSVDLVWAKLFQEIFEVQSIDGHDLGAPPLPFISRRNTHSPGVGTIHYKNTKVARNCKEKKNFDK